MISLLPTRTVALDIAGFAIHWYGIMYLCGFMGAYILMPRLQHLKNLTLTRDQWASFLSAAIIGVIAGGRLGFVLFYEPQYFVQYPQDIVAVWKGGMSSHGGFIGAALAVAWFTRKYNVPILKLADIIVIPAALGLAFGRLGNFINQELYGVATSLPWGIEVPDEEGLRHPTQIYAIIKNLLNALCCFLLLRSRLRHDGQVAGLFLILYGILRFFNEYVRVQTHESLTLLEITLTRGQWLSVPMVIVGCMFALIPFFLKKIQ